MNTDLNPRPTDGLAGHRHWTARFPLRVFPWVLTIALVITNVGTLLSEPAHSAGHEILLPTVKAALENSIWGPTSGGVTSVVGSAEELAKKNRMLEERQKKLESTVIELQRANSAVKAQKADLDNRLLKLKREYTGLQSRHIALEIDRNALKDMSVKRAKAVKTVADRMSRKLAIHAGELLGELPLRAAPYVGVAAVVTGTALDINSDCELARTLNRLVLEHQEAPLDTHAVCQYIDKIPSAPQIWNIVKSKAGIPAAQVNQTVERPYPPR